MKKLLVVAVVAVLAFAAGEALAGDPVNIVYPLDGAVYQSDFNFASITASFGATCPGYSDVSWGFDDTVGNQKFYDQTSVQLVYRLPRGPHKFWVQSSCGMDVVYFKIY